MGQRLLAPFIKKHTFPYENTVEKFGCRCQ